MGGSYFGTGRDDILHPFNQGREDLNDKTILIVEDNADDEALILRALKKSNVANEIMVVRDGAEALDCPLGEGPYEGRSMFKPTVVLLDLKLPKIDGLEVLRRLRADDRTKCLPVVVLTSSDEQEDMVCSYAEMALRWTAAGMMEAQKSFRRLKAYRQLPILRSALQDHMRKVHADSAIETIMQAA